MCYKEGKTEDSGSVDCEKRQLCKVYVEQVFCFNAKTALHLMTLNNIALKKVVLS